MEDICITCKYFSREHYYCSEVPTCQKDVDDGYQQGKDEAIEPIIKILSEYYNGTDEFQGMDESYVIARITDCIGYDRLGLIKEKN